MLLCRIGYTIEGRLRPLNWTREAWPILDHLISVRLFLNRPTMSLIDSLVLGLNT